VAVDNPDVIDAVGTSRATCEVVLTIADHLPWEESHEHLVILQDKLNRYLEFIESGQLAEEYANAKPGVPVRIDIAFKYRSSTDGERFLELARETAQGAGWGFSWRVPAWAAEEKSFHPSNPRVPDET
jgi:hypothetical protein